MAEQNQQPLSNSMGPANHPAASVVATTARWLGFADDLAFGCECADPALQIERWREEAALSAASPS
jgi:hypothetical protein